MALAKSALFLSAAMDLFVYSTPYFPSNRAPGETGVFIAASLAWYTGWLVYLFVSRRVRRTF